MRTSKEPSSKRRNPWHKALSIVVILAVIVAADVLVSLVLEPYGTHSEIVWTEYRKTSDIETLLFGSSTTAYNLDPEPFDEVLNTHTFNLSTPGQSLDNTLQAIQTAAAEHDLDRAIICVGYETMAAPPYINAALAFTQNKCLGEDPIQILDDVGKLVFNEEFFGKHYSLTCAFPWVYNHVEYTVEDILDNVHNRLTYDVIEAGEHYAERLKTSEWLYRSQGFGGVHFALPATTQHDAICMNYPDTVPYEKNFDSLQAICAFCREQGIKLYVVGSPYRYVTVRQYGDDYVKTLSRVRDLVTEEGAEFFDLNLIHRDLLSPTLEDYCDFVHLSAIGAPKASLVVAELIERIESGQDVSNLFYDYTPEGWQEFCDAATFVDTVDYSEEVNDGIATITAIPCTGSGTPVEYRLEEWDATAGEWVMTRDFEEDPVFTIAANGRDSAGFRITAHAITGDQDVDRSVEGSVSF